MDDKHPVHPISLWCYAKEPGKKQAATAPVPCRKEACEWYREHYPYCIHMERRDRRGFRIPD